MPAHPAATLRTLLRFRAGLLGLGLLFGVWVIAAPKEVWGQAPEMGPEPAVQGSLLVGSRGLGSRAHPFVGLEGSVHRDRFGVAATGHLGSGNDYRSTLLGLGPSVRLVTAASTRLSVWAGVSRYREELDGDLLPPGSGTADRSVTGGILGVTLRRPLPWGSVSLHATWLTGRLDDEDLVVPHRVQGLRLAVGLGR